MDDLSIKTSDLSQIERDLQKYAAEKVQRVVHDAVDLLDGDMGACARVAIFAATAAIGAGAAFLRVANERRGGPVPSERDFYFAVLKLIGDQVPAALKDVRRG